jgi:hypothetical protein
VFYNKYLDDYYINEIFNNYDINFLRSIDEGQFISVYNIFKKYNFYYIEDIIENYLELFTMDSNIVEEKILLLKDKLGDNFVNLIGEDMTYLEEILK